MVGSYSSNRRGLSLLELLLSVGLGLLLVAGIYSAIDQSARQTSIGKIEMERLQIARAVFRRMELDLRATMFEAGTAVSDSGAIQDASSTSSSSSSSGSSSSGTDSSSSTESTVIGSSTSEEDQWTGSLGIRGSATELWIDLSYIRRQIDFSLTAGIGTSDLQTVAYFLTSADTQLDDDESIFSGSDTIGLARSQGDRSVLRSLNSSSGDSTLPGPTELLAPEIDQVQFRYFDGLAWYEEWDSSTTGSLPRAVEITIGFEPPAEDNRYLSSTGVSSSTDSFRLVVAIPVADPLVEEEE